MSSPKIGSAIATDSGLSPAASSVVASSTVAGGSVGIAPGSGGTDTVGAGTVGTGAVGTAPGPVGPLGPGTSVGDGAGPIVVLATKSPEPGAAPAPTTLDATTQTTIAADMTGMTSNRRIGSP